MKFSKEEKKKILSRIVGLIIKDFRLVPIIGAEIEFFIKPAENIPDIFFAETEKKISDAGIKSEKIIPEDSKGHYELILEYSPNAVLIAEHATKVRKIIKDSAKEFGVKVDFSAKPYEKLPGNGLHINISLWDKNKKNVFGKERGEEKESELTEYAIGGLLKTMAESMMFFAQKKAHIKDLQLPITQKQKHTIMPLQQFHGWK